MQMCSQRTLLFAILVIVCLKTLSNLEKFNSQGKQTNKKTNWILPGCFSQRHMDLQSKNQSIQVFV